MNIVRYPQWPTHALQNEIKHVFDRFFEQNGETDESAVVTAQWVPRVDVKEEANHFVLYADLPGIDPAQIEVQMDKGILSIKGERKGESSTETERFAHRAPLRQLPPPLRAARQCRPRRHHRDRAQRCAGNPHPQAPGGHPAPYPGRQRPGPGRQYGAVRQQNLERSGMLRFRRQPHRRIGAVARPAAI